MPTLGVQSPDRMESLYGTNFFLTSNGSLDTHPENTPSRFTNVLTQPIVLNPNIKYEIQLANIHASSFEKMLVAGDYGESYISYNISLFNYDRDSQSYKVNERFTRELFRLAPSKDVEGLFEYDTGNSDFNKTIPNDNGANDVITGKPSQRYQKDKFIKKLSSSMEIKKELNSAFFEKNAILGLLKKI